ncbi:hypothetical protein BH09MYX1_BH09MYX1_04240 [soil metagenome]
MSHLATYLAIAPKSPEELVLRLLIELGAQVVSAQEGSLLVYDPTANDLVFAMTVGGADTLMGQRVPLDKGLTGLAAATREVQIGAPTFLGVKRGEAQAAGPSGVIAAPMLVADDLVGVITAVTFEPGKRFSSKDGELYGRLAAVAGVVVQQRRQLKTIEDQARSGDVKGNEVEHRIAASLGNIGRGGVANALERVAKILAEIEGITGGGHADLEVP